MKLNITEKKILIYILLNFIVGTAIGTVLFYAQLNAQKISAEDINATFNENIKWIDVLGLAYTNTLWLISIFIAFRITPSLAFHPILIARGAVCAFLVSYIINFVGITQAIAAVIPQCFSILPAMVVFSYSIIQRRKRSLSVGKEFFTIRRRDILFTVLLSTVSAGLESLLFVILCKSLF